MKVSGFSFIKNAIKYDYPIVEAIESILPICDEFIIAVGKSDDDTLELIRGIKSDKIKIFETIWDDSLREGGRVLAVETDKAFAKISPDSDWAFYIQGDEVVHEKYLESIYKGMKKYQNNADIDALLFDYINFYGSYDYLADSRHWQRKEIRVIKNNPNIYSYLDAISFRKNENEKLNVAYIDAAVHHYGWVKTPVAMQQKQLEFHKLWHDDEWVDKNVKKVDEYDFSQVESVALFEGTHPKVMEKRLERMNWKFSFDPTKAKKESLRRRFLNYIFQRTGIHIGEFKNYKLVE